MRYLYASNHSQQGKAEYVDKLLINLLGVYNLSNLSIDPLAGGSVIRHPPLHIKLSGYILEQECIIDRALE